MGVRVCIPDVCVNAMCCEQRTIHADIKPENILMAVAPRHTAAATTQQHHRMHTAPATGGVPPHPRFVHSPYHAHQGAAPARSRESAAIRVADWGNSITLDMVPLYLADHEIQPLAYRAPEVGPAVSVAAAAMLRAPP